MPAPDVYTIDGLIQELENQAALLISVATGGPRIDSVQADYAQRRQRLVRALEKRGLTYPFPWPDLWQWYGFWTGSLAGYGPRRTHIRKLLSPTLDALEKLRSGIGLTDSGAAGRAAKWSDLEGRLRGLAQELTAVATRDDIQDIGRRAREVLIDCAGILANSDLVPVGQNPPRVGDAKAWLNLFLAKNAPDSNREELRRLVRDAWDLAQKVTHGDLGRVEAFAAAQATILIVRTMQQLDSNSST
jgi:hypothetical protein